MAYKNKIKIGDIGKRVTIRGIQLIKGADPFDIPWFIVYKIHHHWDIEVIDDKNRCFRINTDQLSKPQ